MWGQSYRDNWQRLFSVLYYGKCTSVGVIETSHTHTHTHTHTHWQVILYFTEGNPLGPLLQKRCRDTDYDCCLAYSEEKVVEDCSNSRHPALVVVDTEQQSNAGVSCLEHLSRLVSICMFGRIGLGLHTRGGGGYVRDVHFSL